MSNLEEHEAEQAAITGACEAGECDHPDCREESTAWHGLRCPECDKDHDLNVAFTGTARLTVDGSEDNGAHEWDDKSPLFCGACGFNGLAEEFKL